MMVFVTGAASSGKSAWAERLAQHLAQAEPRTGDVCATAQAVSDARTRRAAVEESAQTSVPSMDSTPAATARGYAERNPRYVEEDAQNIVPHAGAALGTTAQRHAERAPRNADEAEDAAAMPSETRSETSTRANSKAADSACAARSLIYLATMQPYGEEGARRIARHRALRAGKGFRVWEVPRDLADAVKVCVVRETKGATEGNRTSAATVRNVPVAPRRPEASEDAAVAPELLASPAAADASVQEERKAGCGERPTTDETSAPTAAPCELARSTVLLEDLGNLVANEMFRDFPVDEAAAARAEQAVVEGIRMLNARCGNLVVVGNEVGADGARVSPETHAYERVLGACACALAAQADCAVEVVAGVPNVFKGDSPWR